MKKAYNVPMAELLEFDYTDIITASSGEQITKNPGHHTGCTIMPSGKPIPENAEGY